MALKRFIGSCAFAGVVFSATASSVQAKPIEQMRFREQGTEFVDNYCGDLSVRIDLEDSGVIVVKQTGRDKLPRYTAAHHGGLTVTNLATEKAFTFTWNYATQDVRVTDNGDGTFTVLFQIPGPERIYGPDGRLLNTSGGTIRFAAVIDHNGTPGDPSDDVFIREDFVSAHGGQPQEPFDYCASFRTLTG